jgi:SAM-dependent methyltransferase
MMQSKNIDEATVRGFGVEWSRFDQAGRDEELQSLFERYFRIFPWKELPDGARGFDAGCGSGRWARFVAPRVGHLSLVDASDTALRVAERNLLGQSNCSFYHAPIDAMPFADGSMDFGYSLGVLHHLPDTEAGIKSCVAKLKPGAPFLLYLYYRFDNRPTWFRRLWAASDVGRRVISRLPDRLRVGVTSSIAAVAYLPLSRLARIAERTGIDVKSFPLSFYRNTSFYTMRTDALDRFGTRLERRFTADEIREMMTSAGLTDVQFSDSAPYWCAVGWRDVR